MRMSDWSSDVCSSDLEIKRAVQTGQVQLGEVLMVNVENEIPVFGADGVPFLATSFDDAAKLWKAQKSVIDKKLAEQSMMELYAVPWPPQGIYSKTEVNKIEDLKGSQRSEDQLYALQSTMRTTYSHFCL